jgi:hypothetical protein
MKYEIAKKLLALRNGFGTEQNFTDQLPAVRRQLSVNRKFTRLLAMKYAIGKITFLGMRFGMGLRPGMFKPCTTAESPSKVSHEVCNWQKLFLRP